MVPVILLLRGISYSAATSFSVFGLGISGFSLGARRGDIYSHVYLLSTMRGEHFSILLKGLSLWIWGSDYRPWEFVEERLC